MGQSITPPTVTASPDPATKEDEVRTITAVTQEQEGKVYHLRGKVKIETSSATLEADEVDFVDETADVSARGHVHYKNLISGEDIHAQRAEFNVRTQQGRFDVVRGTSPAPLQARVGLLSTNNPLYFQGAYAEKRGPKYILFHGTITNCLVPNPWWTLKGPKFDIVPGERAVAYSSLFALRGVPLFYAPYYYKPLGKETRKSGFLTPTFVNSNRLGQGYGAAYYWAINRSYDATYRGTYFSARGMSHNLDFRGKPNDRTSFGGVFYAVQDRGLKSGGRIVRKTPGYSLILQAKSDFGRGFQARANISYLSSFAFRQEFSQSFLEAINSEVSSVGYVTKQWSYYSFNAAGTRYENFITTPTNILAENGTVLRPQGQLESVTLRRLPEVSLHARDRQINTRILPVWISGSAQAGFVSRAQREFTTNRFTERLDVNPRVTTAIRLGHLHIIPSVGLRATEYGQQLVNGQVSNKRLLRRAIDVDVDIVLPSLARTFERKGPWGVKLKHVIEPRVQYRYVTGINDFLKTIRFDDLDLLSNTNQVEVSLANRLFGKQKNGEVREVMSWEVTHRRYFDPTFGGVIRADARNVVLDAVSLTPFAFLDGPRHYSPINSVLRLSPDPRIGIEWRADYDPLKKRFIDSGVSVDARLGSIFGSLGHNQIRSNPLLSPNTNQLTATLAYGTDTRRGWSSGGRLNYDYRTKVLNEAVSQVTYNTDCCGFSVQYRRFGFRQENQFRVAFVVANIGSFGTLRRQDRVY